MATRDGHPDDDQLADLAADVLPLAEARAVEAHVMACERCSLLLADAQRIRGLLVAGDPGPMPADVWARIEAALAGAGAAPAGHPPLVPVHTERVPEAAAPETAAPETAAPETAAWDDDADPFGAPFGTPRRHGASRLGRGSVTSRREARPSGRRSRRTLTAVVGLAAAALVGVVTVKALPTGGSSGGTAAIGGESDSSSAASAAAGGQAAGAGASLSAVPYERTGTAYTSAGLARQAQGLTRARSAGPAAAAPAVTGPVTPAVPAPSRPAQRYAQAAPDPTATDISNPANLDGCLTALKTSRDRLVAVDLATYDDREAAVLVLRAAGGGYEVFVVERTCSAADDHSLAYATLKG